MLRPGDILADRYRVVRTLGQGGMATVYLVQHVELGTEHALKLTLMESSRRAIDEGRLQGALRHPNIVVVTDTVEYRNRLALVM